MGTTESCSVRKKLNFKRLRNQNRKEIAPEPALKAPPPTPCMSFQQRSGSVPDVRIVDVKKERLCGSGSYHRSLVQVYSSNCKSAHRSVLDFLEKKSTSEHVMTSGDARGPWTTFAMGPCTSNLLCSVRQRLMNL